MRNPFYLKLLVCLVAMPALADAAPVMPQVEQAVRSHWIALAESRGWKAPDVEVKLSSRAPANLQCAIPVSVDVGDARYPTRMPLKATCNDAQGWTHELVARVTINAEVLVTTGPVASGAPLAASDVRLESRDVT